MNRRETIIKIQRAVAQHYDCPVAILKGPSKTASAARPRRMAMFLARAVTGASYPAIGRAFGGRDHSTVIVACRRFAELAEADPTLRETAEALARAVLDVNLAPAPAVHASMTSTTTHDDERCSTPIPRQTQAERDAQRYDAEKRLRQLAENRIIANEGRDKDGDLVIRNGKPHPAYKGPR